MKVQELGHVVLWVRDIERSRHFYGEVLGWPQVGPVNMKMPVAAFTTGRTHHELLLIEVGADATPIPPGRRVGMYHIGVKIGDSDDDLREALDRLGEEGVPVVGSSDHTVTHSLYILDPDGNEIELYIDVPGVDWTQPGVVTQPVKELQL
jgi:catechol 2,3-dioxygenase